MPSLWVEVGLLLISPNLQCLICKAFCVNTLQSINGSQESYFEICFMVLLKQGYLDVFFKF